MDVENNQNIDYYPLYHVYPCHLWKNLSEKTKYQTIMLKSLACCRSEHDYQVSKAVLSLFKVQGWTFNVGCSLGFGGSG